MDMDYFCDNCRVHLNTQKSFNHYQDYWQCTSCGYTNKLGEEPEVDLDSLLGDLKGTSLVNLFED